MDKNEYPTFIPRNENEQKAVEGAQKVIKKINYHIVGETWNCEKTIDICNNGEYVCTVSFNRVFIVPAY
jgi:hypothetical protein